MLITTGELIHSEMVHFPYLNNEMTTLLTKHQCRLNYVDDGTALRGMKEEAVFISPHHNLQCYS